MTLVTSDKQPNGRRTAVESQCCYHRITANRRRLKEHFVGGSSSVDGVKAGPRLLLLLVMMMVVVGGGVVEHVHGSLFVGNVQQPPRPVHGHRRRTAAKPGTAAQHRGDGGRIVADSAAPRAAGRVQSVDLLVVQVGDEHVTGSVVDRHGAREEGATVSAARRRTPAPLGRSSVRGQTRHLSSSVQPLRISVAVASSFS